MSFIFMFWISVVNDAAREAIPEELRLGLVLTIYEAKGLEFDDVLLYNFFKDSQVYSCPPESFYYTVVGINKAPKIFWLKSCIHSKYSQTSII